MRRSTSSRGLKALARSRAERTRTLVTGRAPMRGMPPVFWLWFFIGATIFGVLYWKRASDQVEAGKAEVMARQRSIAQELGGRLLPFRDRVEGWTTELAKDPWPGDHVTPGLDLADVQRATGVYLRLRQQDALTAESVRRAAAASLLDGFTSCFFITPGNRDPSQGVSCETEANCQPGELCNEYHVCAPPPRPYNLRLAYRALRILSTGWTDELHQTSNENTVRVYGRDLERASKSEVPLALEVLGRAKYFTVLLDEAPSGGVAPETPGDDELERLHGVPHPVRFAVYRLSDGARLVALRLQADAVLRSVAGGGTAPTPAATRQVISCSIAFAAKQRLTAAPPSSASSGSDAGAPPPASSAAP